MSKSNPISVDELRQLLRYDPDTGDLFWLTRDVSSFKAISRGRTWNSRNAGKKAGTLDPSGYRKIMLKGTPRWAHRVAWALFYGAWPEKHIDHVNGNCSDNRIANLRCVSHSDNMKNVKKPVTNKSGVVGVFWCQKSEKWKAAIQVDGVSMHIGLYSCFNDAVAARRKAERQYGFHANHGR